METVQKMLERFRVFIVDHTHLIGAKGASALSERVFLVGGEYLLGHFNYGLRITDYELIFNS